MREETPFCNVVSKRKEQRVEMIYCGDVSVKAFSHPCHLLNVAIRDMQTKFLNRQAAENDLIQRNRRATVSALPPRPLSLCFLPTSLDSVLH